MWNVCILDRLRETCNILNVLVWCSLVGCFKLLRSSFVKEIEWHKCENTKNGTAEYFDIGTADMVWHKFEGTLGYSGCWW